jgi:hypothetical protein
MLRYRILPFFWFDAVDVFQTCLVKSLMSDELNPASPLGYHCGGNGRRPFFSPRRSPHRRCLVDTAATKSPAFDHGIGNPVVLLTYNCNINMLRMTWCAP